MPAFTFQLDVRDPPEQVIGKMIDFSDRWPDVWPALSARHFRLHELGDGTADVLGRCIVAMLHRTRGAPIKRSFRQVYGS